jgi:hypothetical protein
VAKAKKKLTSVQRKKAGLPLHLSLSPQHITADAWYYEEKTGLHLVIWGPKVLGHQREVQHFRIKWRQILNTMTRYRRFKNNPEGSR